MQNQKELGKLLNTDSEESQPKPPHRSIWARYPDPIKSGARYPDPPKSEERFQEAMQVKTRKKRQPKKQKISELGDSVAPGKDILFEDRSDSKKLKIQPPIASLWERYPDPPTSGARFQEAMSKFSESGDTVAPDKGISFGDNGALELLASASLTVPRAEIKEGEMHPADEMALAEWKKHSSYDRWVVEADCTKTNPEYCTTLFDHYEEVRRNIYEKARNACKDATPAAPCASS